MRYVRHSDQELGDWYVADEKEICVSYRKPNELLISVEVLQDLFRSGTHNPAYHVKEGPAVEARIVGAHYDEARHWVVLEYDQSIDECLFERDAAAVA